MLSRSLITIGLLTAAWVVPLCGQTHNSDEEGKLTYSIGGGLGIPLNPSATFTGVGGSFISSGGYNIDQHSSVIGEFGWSGLPPSLSARAQLFGASASVNVYSLTANYRFRGNLGKTFGYYFIAGGGWYYRHSSISKTTIIPTETVCQPIYGWYGYTCSDGFVDTRTVGAGTSSAGGNGGVGFTIRVRDTGWKFFMESRYNYAASRFIATSFVPVTFGFVYQ